MYLYFLVVRFSAHSTDKISPLLFDAVAIIIIVKHKRLRMLLLAASVVELPDVAVSALRVFVWYVRTVLLAVCAVEPWPIQPRPGCR